MLTLNLPQRNDPASRILLIALLAAALWANVAQIETPAQAQGADPGVIIYQQATPTPALPTPAGDAPALGLIAPTPTPEGGWLDQGLAAAAAAGDGFAQRQADQLAAEQAAAAAQAAADQAQYLANVGAQSPHSPRGDVPPAPPEYSPGPVAQPVNADGVIVVIDPNPVVAPAGPQYAAAVRPISADQAAIIGARQSNGCPDGQTFYPRTGCHLAGSGGPQPGAVGEATP